MRDAQGGIRSYNDASLWSRDEEVFRRKLKEWDVSLKDVMWINLDCGIGDHWIFRMAFDDILKKHGDKLIYIASAHPTALDGIPGNVHIVSIADGLTMLGKNRMDDINVYAFCIRENWTGTIVEAFKKLYA
jgi:hypothetical protein